MSSLSSDFLFVIWLTKHLMRTNSCHHFNDVGRLFDYRTPNLEATESCMFEIFENKNSFDCYTETNI